MKIKLTFHVVFFIDLFNLFKMLVLSKKGYVCLGFVHHLLKSSSFLVLLKEVLNVGEHVEYVVLVEELED